jgi:hypothetical protein
MGEKKEIKGVVQKAAVVNYYQALQKTALLLREVLTPAKRDHRGPNRAKPNRPCLTAVLLAQPRSW